MHIKTPNYKFILENNKASMWNSIKRTLNFLDLAYQLLKTQILEIYILGSVGVVARGLISQG